MAMHDGGASDVTAPLAEHVAPPMARILIPVDAAIILLCAAVTIAGVDQAVRTP